MFVEVLRQTYHSPITIRRVTCAHIRRRIRSDIDVVRDYSVGFEIVEDLPSGTRTVDQVIGLGQHEAAADTECLNVAMLSRDRGQLTRELRDEVNEHYWATFGAATVVPEERAPRARLAREVFRGFASVDT